MDRNIIEDYKRYMSSIFNFMVENSYTSSPKPRVILRTEVQDGEPYEWMTGYYEPEEKCVVIYTEGRAMKDCLRSFAHELIHHKQNMEGRLDGDAYSGTSITEDNRLIKLEEEAYKEGNIAFRSWTELEKKKNK